MGPHAPGHVPAVRPADAAAALDDAHIHVWWLPRRRGQGREPLLRVLAGYLDAAPETIRLDENPHGRPQVDGALDFNWSHSRERAVVAVARHLPRLGVDLEHVRPRRSFMALAERFFADSEYALLAALPEEQRPSAFVRLWTAKEALLKAHGRGLAYGLDKAVLTLEDDAPRPLRFDAGLGEPATWHLAHWTLPEQGFASLCWQHGQRRLRHFTLPDPPSRKPAPPSAHD